jgi:hypothetical protein
MHGHRGPTALTLDDLCATFDLLFTDVIVRG